MTRIVALIGIDGAGKTTQARALAAWLSATGTPATYHRNAGGRMFLGRVAQRFGRRDAEHLLGVRLLLMVEATLRWLAIARGLLRSKLTGTVAVMDRYSYCQYTSVRVRGGRGERWTRLLFRVFPQPDLVCFLAVSPAVAHARVVARGTDSEELDYLAACDATYRALPEAVRYVTVDADASPDEVQRALRRVVLRQAVAEPPRLNRHLLPIG